jgi:hypothetical protein
MSSWQALSALLLLPSCAGSAIPNGDEQEAESAVPWQASGDQRSAPSRTRELFCEAWADAACADAVVSACQSATPEACRLSQTAFCMTLVPSTFEDGPPAYACTEAVRAAYADAALTGPELAIVLKLGAPCDRMMRGTAALGASCKTNADCDGPAGHECVVTHSGGSCQVPILAAPGSACTAPDVVCPRGFRCDRKNCVEALSLGECCSKDRECAPSAYCGKVGTSIACAARQDLGSACSADNQCASGLCYAATGSAGVCADRLDLSPSEPVCSHLR